MKDAIFYTFSTIPQVLAGAIALIGVFTIFKIKALQDTLSGIAQNFYDEVKESFLAPYNKPSVKESVFNSKIRIFKEHKISYNYKMIKEEMYNFMSKENELIMGRGYLKVFLDLIISRYIFSYDKINKIKKDTLKIIVFSAIIILVSISIIPFAKILPCWLAIVLFAIFIILVGINFLWLISIIKESIEDPPDPSEGYVKEPRSTGGYIKEPCSNAEDSKPPL